MELRILGSAAGGGFPQWNCACRYCVRARTGELRSRTQDSLAVTGNGRDWFLINASPDVSRQIEATPELWPRQARQSPIRGVVLTNGDLDHVLGLFTLREGHPLAVYATPEVRAGLEQNSMLRTLMRYDGQLTWRNLSVGRSLELRASDDSGSGIWLRPFAAPGKPPLHLAGRVAADQGDNVGLKLQGDSGNSGIYLSATAAIAPVARELDGAAWLLLDGTFWSERELIDAGLGATAARDMAHVPMSGPEGSLAACRDLRLGRRLFTHINNTNPVLDPASAERATLAQAAWELAEDGQRLELRG